MLQELDIPQFLEWMAYAELEPFGEDWDNLRSASIVTALYNLFGRKKGQDPYALSDFVLRFKEPQAPRMTQTLEQQKAIARMWVEASKTTTPKRKRSK